MNTQDTEQRELRAELVGREEELALLRRKLDEVEEGHGAVVVLRAEAGLGKTRLMEEVEAQVGERGMLFLRGAGDERKAGLAYGVFADVLRTYLEDAAAEARDGVKTMVASLAPHLWEGLFPGEPMPEGASEDDMRPELRQSLFLARLGRLLLQLSRHRPLVLCLDDVHWADSASLQMLRFLTGRGASSALMVLVGTEPADKNKTPVLRATLQDLQRQPQVHVCDLKPLSPVQVRALVDSCFQRHNFSHALLTAMHAKSGGSPLFALQYLEYLLDNKMIFERQGLWVNGEVAGPQEPTSIRATLRHRLQKLEPEELQILAYAAAQGESFAGRWVARSTDLPLTKVLRTLSQLMRRTRMLRVEEEKFRFSHPLLVEVCYEFLPQDKRRQAHLRLASILEEVDAHNAEDLAYHLYRAGAWERALEHLLEAARRARAAFAYEEARRFLGQGQEAVQVLGEKAHAQHLEVLLMLAEIEDRTGSPEKALELCRRAIEVATPGAERQAVGRALMQMGWVESRRGDWQEATRLYNQALEAFSDLGDEERLAMVYVRLGNIAFERGQLEEAEARFRDAKDTATRAANYSLLGAIYGNLGVVCSVRGQFVEAVLSYTEALKAYRHIDHSYGLCQTFHNLGMTHADQEEWKQALKWYEEGLELAGEMGTVDVEANILVSQAVAQIGVSDLEGAEKSCLRARRHMEQLGDRLGVAECRKVEGIIWRERQEHGRAAERLQEGRHLFEELENQLGMAECDLELGLLLKARGDVDGARQRLEDSQRIFREIGAEQDARRAEELLAALAS